MRVGVIANLVPCGKDGARGVGIVLHIDTDHKKGRFDIVSRKDLENSFGKCRMRTVIEGQRDLHDVILDRTVDALRGMAGVDRKKSRQQTHYACRYTS